MTGKPLSGRKVLITDYIWPDLDVEQNVMGGLGARVVAAPDGSEATLAGLARDADAIVTCFAPVTGNVLRAAPRCVMVSRYGVGVDNIDVATATELGMVVAYVPDYCMDEVSDHAMSLLLALNRRLLPLARCARSEGWGTVPLTLPVMRLRAKVLGLVGMTVLSLLFGVLMPLLVIAIKVALVLVVGYFILRLVSPSDAEKVRDKLNGLNKK